MNSQFQVSAKTLGQLALPDFCARCFWIRLRCRNRFPFAIFPGIFSSIDSYSKKVTATHFTKHGRVPFWFDGFGEIGTPINVPHWSKFNTTDPTTSITLTGVPDEILRKRDGSLFVGDYKCARFTETADELLPLYGAQLNVYAYIAPHIGMGDVSALGLLYYEPVAQLTPDDVDSLVESNGFQMRFTPKVLPVQLNATVIPRLLARVREIHDCPSAPAAKDGCNNCSLLDAMIDTAMR